MDAKQIQWRKDINMVAIQQAAENLQKHERKDNSIIAKCKANMPSIVNKTRGICTLDYKKYLSKCKITRRSKIKNRYNIKKWSNLLTSVGSNEIILKRWELEMKIQEGIKSIVQAQILDTLIMDRNNDDEEEKLNFNSKYENSTYLLDKFTEVMGINPETVAFSLYQKKYMEAIKNQIKRKLPYIPQEAKDMELEEMSLIAKAEALSEMHNCKLLCAHNENPICLNKEHQEDEEHKE